MDKPWDIAVLTDRRWTVAQADDDYTANVLLEDRLVVEALERVGLRTLRLSWDDPEFDWSSVRAILFRTTWDYDDRPGEFFPWLERIPPDVHVINPLETIRWNIAKTYLQDLEDRGIPIIPTHFSPKGSADELRRIMAEKQWVEAVIKPVVAGGGRETYRVNAENLPEMERRFQDLTASEDMMIQAFQHDVLATGEWSFMVFGETLTHAVLKVARPGDFRVQDDFGGTVHAHAPTSEERAFVSRVMAALDPVPTYSRLDVIRENRGELAIGELELIEPELWFRLHPPAADVLAKEILRRYFPR